MTIGDLRGWLRAVPEEMDDINVVYRKYEAAEKDEDQKEDSELFYATDTPMSSIFIDKENNECCFLDEKSRSFIIKMNQKLKEKK
jgi:hypothetical protein